MALRYYLEESVSGESSAIQKQGDNDESSQMYEYFNIQSLFYGNNLRTLELL